MYMLDPLVGFHKSFFNKIHVKFHYTLEKILKKANIKLQKKCQKKKKGWRRPLYSSRRGGLHPLPLLRGRRRALRLSLQELEGCLRPLRPAASTPCWAAWGGRGHPLQRGVERPPSPSFFVLKKKFFVFFLFLGSIFFQGYNRSFNG